MESLLYDVSFWLVLNFFLIVAVVGLVLIRQSIAKPQSKPTTATGTKMLEEEKILYDSLVKQGKGKEAVETVFPMVYRKICEYAGVSIRGLTVKELLRMGKLSPSVTALLQRLYDVYEPTKFADIQPSDQMVSVFGETLEKLVSELSIHE
ncbi:MAG: hypothetical protein NZ921_01800 [Candidatus Caldarchaeum sp.]|nr:hypothetical protein [Candidatus Caldarchaeum sp.]MCS7133521.1 hypothetical protein [Candidatus Caldarchaeum sp.]MCX8201155.1 hypothetical protein [Candidatus Caldarchaeum sp.]MDW8434718.1 hypothetical protein [Candidatus Caldarchaeum sp.]